MSMHIEVYGLTPLPLGFRVETTAERERLLAEEEARCMEEYVRRCHEQRGVFICEERWDLCAALIEPRAARARVERSALYLGTAAPDWLAGAAESTHRHAVAEIDRLERAIAWHDRDCPSCRV